MSIKHSAIEEMRAANFAEDDIEAMTKIMDIFFAQWDSGGAVFAMLPVMERLMRGLPLGPLTGADDEWLCGHAAPAELCQNKRCGSVFKNGEKVWDIDNAAWDGSFPYEPSRRNLDPVVEIEVGA